MRTTLIMLCPKCSGSGLVHASHLNIPPTGFLPGSLYPCDYEGCHSGHISCCDGLAKEKGAEAPLR
jgi:hypothetical protein